MPSEPSTKTFFGSSVELELAGEENKDLEKYTRRYEEGYNLYDPQYYAWLQCTHPTYAKAWYQTAVKIGSVSGEESATGEQETEAESSDLPGPSQLPSAGPSKETNLDKQDNNIQSDDNDSDGNIHVHN